MYDKQKEESYISSLGLRIQMYDKQKEESYISLLIGSEDTNVWQTKGKMLFIITHWGLRIQM